MWCAVQHIFLALVKGTTCFNYPGISSRHVTFSVNHSHTIRAQCSSGQVHSRLGTPLAPITMTRICHNDEKQTCFSVGISMRQKGKGSDASLLPYAANHILENKHGICKNVHILLQHRLWQHGALSTGLDPQIYYFA